MRLRRGNCLGREKGGRRPGARTALPNTWLRYWKRKKGGGRVGSAEKTIIVRGE